MLSQQDIELLKVMNIINNENKINFDAIRKNQLVLLHNNNMIWLQPRDKEIIPSCVHIVNNPDFLTENSNIKLYYPFKQQPKYVNI